MYRDFAYIYDNLLYDINVTQWVGYIESIFDKYNKKPEIILDLACGTGRITTELAKKGYDMIGIDLSSEMLNVAKDKATAHSLDVLYLNQNMSEFELYGTVDAVICLLDSFNYLINEEDLYKTLNLINNYLNPEGILIFDINSKYKLSKILGNNVFYDVSDQISYIWENKFINSKNICEMDLTFFQMDKDGKYIRYDEIHTERAYSINEIDNALKSAKLNVIGKFNEFTFDIPDAKSERIFFIAEK